MQQIEWDAELEEMSREKAAAEATRGSSRIHRFSYLSHPIVNLVSSDLKARFRAQAARQRGRAAPRGASTLGRPKQGK